MNSRHPQDDANKTMDRDAALWVWRCDQGLSAEHQDAFIDWMTADPRHAAAYDRHRANWKRLNGLSDWCPEHSGCPNPDLLAPARPRPVRWFSAGLAAMAALWLVVFGIQQGLAPKAPRLPNNPDPGNVTQELDDGSRLFSRGESDYKVQFGEWERRVILRTGEVYFQVAKDAARPFVVEAGTFEMLALGTAFKVNFTDGSLELLVEEGTVKMDARNEERRATGPEESERILAARQRAFIRLERPEADPRVEQLSELEVKNAMSWQHRNLYFNAQPLEEVVAEFNRLNQMQLTLEDPALASVKISGAMHSANIDGFIRLLEIGFGIGSQPVSRNSIQLYIKNPEVF